MTRQARLDRSFVADPTSFIDPACQRCPLASRRTQVVPAEGIVTARLFVVGEAPGFTEDREGRPFVGFAGKVLRKALVDAGIPIEDVWISNAVRCIPRSGASTVRPPTQPELDACRSHLIAELRAVQPRVVVALGASALRALTDREVPIAQVRGSYVTARSDLPLRSVLATFHPSGLHYRPNAREEFLEDLRHAWWAAAVPVTDPPVETQGPTDPTPSA